MMFYTYYKVVEFDQKKKINLYAFETIKIWSTYYQIYGPYTIKTATT